MNLTDCLIYFDIFSRCRNVYPRARQHITKTHETIDSLEPKVNSPLHPNVGFMLQRILPKCDKRDWTTPNERKTTVIEIVNSILSHLPSWAELMSAIPVIVSLILIEGLLSVDNAMAIAAMASALPKEQQKKALRYGIIGAYAFRGICLVLVAFIASNPWLKVFGALYLIYLMCEHLSGKSEEEIHGSSSMKVRKSLLATIIQIEIMDLSLSLDNVVAAVALDKRLWVVCLGVFIGILALRFVAGHCIKLIERFPVLKQTAFLLVGFVGVILITELSLEYFNVHFHINSLQKFVGIVIITVGSLLYSESASVERVLKPVVVIGSKVIKVLDLILGYVMWPITWSLRLTMNGGKSIFRTLRTILN